MEERQATIDGTTYPMPDPFLVIATQNPIEYEGTFALPEAQLDRFMLRLRLGYPQPIEEIVILDEQKRTHPLEDIEEVLSVEELREMQAAVREIYVDSTVSDYIVRLVNGTRNHPDVYLGASPRGSIALYRAGQALAGLLGRDYVIPDDIKALAEPALAHRLIIKTSSSIHDVQAGQVVRELLESTAIDGIRPTGGGPTELRPGGPRLLDGDERLGSRSSEGREAHARMIRKLELLIVAVVLVVAAFSTALPFLFYLLYLAILVIGGSYVLVRLGLTDLEAGYAVSQLHGHVGDRMRVTYTLRNAQPDPEAVARDPQPDDAARRPARAGRSPSPAGPSGRGSSARRCRDAATSGSSRSTSGPAIRSASSRPRRRSARGSRSWSIRGSSRSRAGGCPAAALEGSHASPVRTLQTTPMATSVRPYAPGDAMNRIHWKTTARHGEIQVKEFDLEQTADAWIILDLQRGIQTGRGDESTVEAAVRAAAAIADKALQENRAVGLTVNVGRTAFLPPDRGGRQHLKIMQLLAAVEADGSAPLVETLIRRVGRLRRGHDRGHHHAVARPGLGPAARGAPDARRGLRRGHPRQRGVREVRGRRRGRRPNGEPAPVDVGSGRARRQAHPGPPPCPRRVRAALLRRHPGPAARRDPGPMRRRIPLAPAEGWLTLGLRARSSA